MTHQNFYIIILLSLFLTLFSCQSKDSNITTGDQSSPRVQTVGVVQPSYQNFMAEVHIAGTARPYQKVMLHAMEDGYVKSVKKDIGDFVNIGEVVAVQENPELYRQQEKLKVQLHGKKVIYDRLNSIRTKTPALTTTQQVENSQTEYAVAMAEMEGINDRITFLTVKAPFHGTITKRMVDIGSLVQ